MRYSTLATQMGITIFLGVWGGMKLDRYFQNRVPWFTIGLSLLALVISMYNAMRDFLRPVPRR